MLGERDSRTILTNTTLVRGEFAARDVINLEYHGLLIARFFVPTIAMPGRVEVCDAGYTTTSTTARIAAIIHGQGLITRVVDGVRRVGSVKYGEVELSGLASAWMLAWEETCDGDHRVVTFPGTGRGEAIALEPAA